MNLLDFRILIFALSVTNSISSSGFKPSFSPNKFLGLINDNVLLKISLNYLQVISLKSLIKNH